MSDPRTEVSVFTYGTLVVPEVMAAVTGKSFPSTPALLEGYAAFQVEGECFPALTVAGSSSTPGVMYLGVDKETLKLIDKFEGKLYKRKRVAVRSDTLGLMSAETYVIAESSADKLSSQEWDVETFRSEHLEAWLEVCAEFNQKGKR